MINTSKTIVFFGTEQFSLRALSSLFNNGYTISAVVTKPDSARGRGLKVTFPAVKKFAYEHNIPVWQPLQLREITTLIAQIPNRIGVLSAYGKIIPNEVLDLFEDGIINIHPSLLPKYRGSSPIETAIANGDSATGVSIIRLVSQMDAGPVYASQSVDIMPTDDAISMYDKTADVGSLLLLDQLAAIINKTLIPQEQNNNEATYTKLLHRSNAVIDPILMDAQEIERHVRAYIIYPKTRLHVFGHDIIITKAHVGGPESTGLMIPCRNNTSLIIDELISPNGRRIDGISFFNGYADRS